MNAEKFAEMSLAKRAASDHLAECREAFRKAGEAVEAAMASDRLAEREFYEFIITEANKVTVTIPVGDMVIAPNLRRG